MCQVAKPTISQVRRQTVRKGKQMLVLSVHTPSINFLTNDRIYSIKLRALSHMLPLHAPGHGKCFNPRQLFPSDKQWARFDVRDECNTTHVARAFYASTNATCSKQTGAPPISFLCTFPLQYCSYSYCPSTVGLLQSNLMFHTMFCVLMFCADYYILPVGTCIGPFSKPRPWGTFSCLVS